MLGDTSSSWCRDLSHSRLEQRDLRTASHRRGSYTSPVCVKQRELMSKMTTPTASAHRTSRITAVLRHRDVTARHVVPAPPTQATPIAFLCLII